MKKNDLLQLLIGPLFLLLLMPKAQAQDPFFSHFYNNRSFFNPALVGINGALSIQAKHKSQWKGTDTPAFISTSVTFEETILCSFLDYGFSFNYDKEGAGVFETFEPGFRFAGTIPIAELINIRLGGVMQWTWKRIDYTKLIFADQLDPRYGFLPSLTSAFVPPNSGATTGFLTPGVGATFQAISNPRRPVVFDVMVGGAMHNGLSIGNDRFGHTESILGLDEKIPVRLNAFLDVDINFMGNGQHSYYSVNPQVVYQKQGALTYLEAGGRFSFNRFFSMGFYYHSSSTTIEGAQNSNWFSITGELGDVLGTDRRIDLGFSYSSNIAGLRNIIGPTYEFSVSYHFKASPVCSLMGSGDPQRDVLCPSLAQTRKNRKIYENIWYKTLR